MVEDDDARRARLKRLCVNRLKQERKRIAGNVARYKMARDLRNRRQEPAETTSRSGCGCVPAAAAVVIMVAVLGYTLA